MKIIIATNNNNKIREIRDKFSAVNDVQIDSYKTIAGFTEPEENGVTFLENALIKARAIAAFTDNYVLADDSGLAVDYLNGEPGIHSARYCGLPDDESKNSMILSKLSGVPYSQRKAKFVCAIALITPDKKEITVEEFCSGVITESPSGSNGFGYDPIFFIEDYGKTFAELSLDIKNKISHRAKAVDAIYGKLLKDI